MEVQQKSTGLWYSAEFWSFTIGDEINDQYRINVDGYSGDAGLDGLHVIYNDGAFYHDGMMFTTYDHDNDKDPVANCGVTFGSGWWYNKCYWVNLAAQGKHHKWWSLSGSAGSVKILSTSRMMIKPQQ